VHRIHQQVARQPLRRRPPEFRDHQPGQAPAVPPAHLSHAGRAPPQVVQVPVRRPRQAPEALVVEHSKKPTRRPVLWDYDNFGSRLDRHVRPSPVSGEDGCAFSYAESEAGPVSER